ncbi:MAG: transposase [Nodosilinea sp. WJT8-NPBG4]|nr:transposase [Nodosilinea sp. WJT8-NPBG4]
MAARGKTSFDWFFKFKPHMVVNDCGELLNIQLTLSKTDDHKPAEELLHNPYSKIFID